MADINLQPKTGGSHAWIWVVVLIVIALIIWYLVAH